MPDTQRTPVEEPQDRNSDGADRVHHHNDPELPRAPTGGRPQAIPGAEDAVRHAQNGQDG